MFNKLVSNILPYFPKQFVWQFSKKYVAGDTLDDAMRISSQLNKTGILVTIDQLGEFITDIKQAKVNKTSYLEIIKGLERHNIAGSLSVKPTSFGLLIDEEQCYVNMREIVVLAKERNKFVRIDMEDSPCTSKEITLFKRLFKEFPDHVGLVIQAYMRRSMDDLKDLATLHTPEHPINIRLCKGIYIEPEDIAFRDYDAVRKNFLDLLEFMLKKRFYAAIATHDRYLVEKSIDLLDMYEVPSKLFEFQMLLGVTPLLRDEVVSKGYKMKVYVPFGQDWFGYCTRRLKENPKMTTEIIKAVFIKR